MNPIEIGISLLIAIAVPLMFLMLAYSLDLYSIHSISHAIIALLWGGIISLGLAYGINTRVTLPLMTQLNLRHILLYVIFAPIVEELLKLMPLAYYQRRGYLTFFVDGAIYGFATGIGFSIGESFLYLSHYPEIAIPQVLGRAVFTSMMHGMTTALVGIGYGLARMRRLKSHKLVANAAWLIAVAFHGLFNALVLSGQRDMLAILGTMAIAIGGFELTLTFIRLGLKQEKKWLEEGLDSATVHALTQELPPLEEQQLAYSLQHQAEVPFAEVRATQDYEQIDEFLAPLREQFPEHAHDMERIIFQQAQIAIKRRLMYEVDSTDLRQRLQAEIEQQQTQIKHLRKQVGPCAMSYLDCVFDENSKLMQVCVDTVTSCTAPWIMEPATPDTATVAVLGS